MPQNKKRLPLWPALLLIVVIVLLFILNPLCRYVYTKDFVARGDKQLAEMFADRLAESSITDLDKPMFFFGSADTRTNGSCLDLSTGKYNIYSAFAVKDALGLDTLETSQSIVSYLNSLGYTYTAPTETDLKACQADIDTLIPLQKSFPWYDSIMETDNCILVQLSDSVYELYYNPQ